jgi:hypothetical protein
MRASLAGPNPNPERRALDIVIQGPGNASGLGYDDSSPVFNDTGYSLDTDVHQRRDLIITLPVGQHHVVLVCSPATVVRINGSAWYQILVEAYSKL